MVQPISSGANAPMDGVGATALLVAAVRADEANQPSPLFEDPFAALLAGDLGRKILTGFRAVAGAGYRPLMEVRTKFIDDALERAAAQGIRQCVLLGAGMDTRAYRMKWPRDMQLFELDQPASLAYKADRLVDARPRCQRTAIPVDLTQDWSSKLIASPGFKASAPTAWVIEGLVHYLDSAKVTTLLTRVDAHSAPGSVVVLDVVGQSFMKSPAMAGLIQLMEKANAPWTFGTDDPGADLLPTWNNAVSDAAEVGQALGRWPPEPPKGTPGVPHAYLMESRKP